jgi:peptide-methionine (S)-S-oxide reductase
MNIKDIAMKISFAGAAVALFWVAYAGVSTFQPLGPVHAEKALNLPYSQLEAPEQGSAVAVFAGGCFWGVEAVFEQVKGVKSVSSGYAGGTKDTATYDQVSSETTRHAEAVRIVYDPKVVSYGTLLRVFFAIAHDPTQLNRQGPDVGTSYRSAIFPQSRAQDQVARGYITQLTKARSFAKPIVTKIELGAFFAAETYHQDFMRKNPNHPYIRQWDAPKVAAFRAGFRAIAK